VRANNIGYIESEDLMNILVYITGRSQLANLRTHLRMIEDYTPNNVNNSKSGLHLTNFQAALEYILQFKIEQDNP
jgi:hypothetical protein